MNRALITESLRIGSHQLFSSGSGLYVYDVLQGKFPFLISSHTGIGIEIRHVIVNDNFARFIYTNNKSNFVYGFHKVFVKKGDSINVFNDFEVVPSIYKTVMVSQPNSGKVTNEIILDTIDDTSRLVSSKAIQDELQSYLKITDSLLPGSQNKNGNILVWRDTIWKAESLTSAQLKDTDITFQNGSVLRILGNKIKNDPLAQSLTENNKLVSTNVIHTELQNYLHKTNDPASHYMVLHWDNTEWKGVMLTWDHLTNIAGVLQEEQLIVYRNGKLQSSDALANYVTNQSMTQTLQNYLDVRQGGGDYLSYDGTQWTGKTASSSLSDMNTENTNLITTTGVISYLSSQKETSITNSEKLSTGTAVISYVRDYVNTVINDYRLADMLNNFRNVLNSVTVGDVYLITKSNLAGDRFNYLKLSEFQDTIKEEIGTGVMSVEISSGSGHKGPVLYYTPNLGSQTELSDVGIVAYDRTSITDFEENTLYVLNYNTSSKLFELRDSVSRDITVKSLNQSSSFFTLQENGDITCKELACDNIAIQGKVQTNHLECSGTLIASGSGIFDTIQASHISTSSGVIQELQVNTITITGSSTFQDVSSTNLTLTNLSATTANISQRIQVPSLEMNVGTGTDGSTLRADISEEGIRTNTALIFYDTSPTTITYPNDARIREGNLTILNKDRELENITKLASTLVESETIQNSSDVITATLDTQTLTCSGTGTFDTVSCQNLGFNVLNQTIVRDGNGNLSFSYSNSIFQTACISDSDNDAQIAKVNITGVPQNGYQFSILYERASSAGVSTVTIPNTFTVTEDGTDIKTLRNTDTLTIQPGEYYLIEGRRVVGISSGVPVPTYLVEFKKFYD